VTSPRVVYRTSGTYDAGSDVVVEPDGAFRAEDGGYVTRGPREGQLSLDERAELVRLAAALGPPTAYGMTGVDGFVCDLRVDDGRHTWCDRPPTPALAAIVRFLSIR